MSLSYFKYFEVSELKIDFTFNRIHVDVRATLECAIVENRGLDAFSFIYDRLEDRKEEGRWTTSLRNALACTRDASNIDK